jgi:MSHA pilin protein MshC
MALCAIPFSLVVPASRKPVRRTNGFSFVELVMIISIIGIIAVFAMSRIGGGYADTARYYQQLMAQITYARKTAIAQRRPVCVHIAAGQSQVLYADPAGTSCPTGPIPGPIPSPTGQVGMLITAPAGTSTTAGTGNIMFDATGRYLDDTGTSTGATRLVTVLGEGTYNLTIEPETGYVHP